MLRPRAILFAIIGMVVIGSAVFYCSVPEKRPPDPRYAVRFSAEKTEWHTGDDVFQMQNAAEDVFEGYYAETIQKKILLISEKGERLTLWVYIRSLQYFTTNGFDYEIIEYQFLLRYPDKTMIDYVNAVILSNEEGELIFEDPIILGKVNFKIHVGRYMRSNERDELLPTTSVGFFFSPEPEQQWIARRIWTYEWNSEMEKEPVLVTFSNDGSASVPTHFTMEMFESDNP